MKKKLNIHQPYISFYFNYFFLKKQIGRNT